MKHREFILALVVFTVLSLILGAGTEIISIPSPHDDGFYVMKSLKLFGSWSNLETIKEIASPLFFAAIRSLHIPLRMAFGLAFACSLLFILRELRLQAFPPVVCWIAALLPMFIPTQFWVFSRATSDPLLVSLTACLLAACLAVYRTDGNWVSIITAGFFATMIWLDRPEGILALPPVLFTLALVAVKQRFRGQARLWALCGKAAAVIGMLGVAMLVTSTLNWIYYRLPASTMMKAPAYRRTLKLLMEIDDGKPRQPYLVVSKRALELAFSNSPAMAQAREYWRNNSDGKGWSGFGIPGYATNDGSVEGGHFMWALRDSSVWVAGGRVGDELSYLKRAGDELESAMDRGALPHRFVLSSAVGPYFNPFGIRFWQSFMSVGKGIAAGASSIVPPEDTASSEQDRIFDAACSRRTALIFKNEGQRVHVQGWIVMAGSNDIPDSISVQTTSPDVSFLIENRPDVPKVLLNKEIHPAWCGFHLDVPLAALNDTFLVVDGDGAHERLAAPQWKMKTGSQAAYGHAQIYVDAMTEPGKNPASSRWEVMNKWGAKLSRFMSCVGAVSLLALALVIFARPAAPEWSKTRRDFLVTSLVAGAIVLPRWALLAALDSSLWVGLEPRYLMPDTVAVWAWEVLALGVAATLLIQKARKSS